MIEVIRAKLNRFEYAAMLLDAIAVATISTVSQGNEVAS